MSAHLRDMTKAQLAICEAMLAVDAALGHGSVIPGTMPEETGQDVCYEMAQSALEDARSRVARFAERMARWPEGREEYPDDPATDPGVWSYDPAIEQARGVVVPFEMLPDPDNGRSFPSFAVDLPPDVVLKLYRAGYKLSPIADDADIFRPMLNRG